MIFFSICWGQEYSVNLKKSLLLEQLLLLDGPCPLQPRCGHQCNVTLLTFCSISSAITLLWPFGPTEQYVFFPNFGKMLITSFRLLSSRNASVRVSILLAPAAMKGEASCWIIVLFWYKKHRKHPRQWFQRGLQTKTWVFSRHSTRLFSPILKQGIFMPYQLLGFPQNNVLSMMLWLKRTKMCFKLQKFSPCKGDGDKGGTTQGTPAAILAFARKEESPALPVMGHDAEQGQFPSPFNQSSLLP